MEIGLAFSEEDTGIVLKKNITESENYQEECIMELANTNVNAGQNGQSQKKEEMTEKLRIEHGLEMETYNVLDSTIYSDEAREHSNKISIEKFIISVKTLSNKVPEETQDWNLFYNSLKGRSNYKSIEKQKTEILLNML